MHKATTTQIAMKSSRWSSPSCKTKSALDKNLKAKPISSSPKTTLTLLSHPPDWGNEFNQPGKAENNINGKASASENPNITAVGAANEPVAAPANALPTRGPVHEKETMAKVAAMKKIPINPPRSAAWSVLFAQLVGNWISKAPKKLAPNTTNSRNKKTLKNGSVEMTLRMSTPNTAVRSSPSPV